ncbi:MAG: ribonuclease HI [Pseudomonadota bacterium]|nr:ribonuclease HI [Pseudomonadota bacterium]
MTEVRLFTDGACSGNPGPGGWGAVIINEGKIQKFSGGELNTTNNRMELQAAIEGIKKSLNANKIILYTDSKYLKDGITIWVSNWRKNNWLTSSKKPVKNKDLWIQLDALNSNLNISWRWVKAHQNSNTEETELNNLADTLAREAII